MQAYDIYRDIAERTQGDVYIGVVGPVRTGKSTFIKRFMEKLVLPGMENLHAKTRALDELPQSGSGKTVMTTQPVFVPNEAANVKLPGDHPVRIRMIDSVGFLVDGALGTQDESGLRMVQTPWFAEEIPFERAAEIGTRKVIADHSTLGIVVTTDGSVTEFPRSAYLSAEKQTINELQALKKPFIVILNTDLPEDRKTESLRASMEEEYKVPVLAVNVAQMEEKQIHHALERALGQFPILEIRIQTPEWLNALHEEHWLFKSIQESIQSGVPEQMGIGEIKSYLDVVGANSYTDGVIEKEVCYGKGEVQLQIILKDGLFNQVLAEQCGTEIKSDAHLLSLLCELVAAKREYDHVAQALNAVRETGYGLVPPLVEEMTLQEPEIMKQGGRFGVRLRASAPSLHMIRVDIQTEVSPVVGTEEQSEEMIRYLMEGFEHDPQKLWQSNLFGKPLSDLVREGLANKLMHMPEDTQLKMQQTLGRIINEGTGGMICILL